MTVASLFGATKPETKIWLKIKEIVAAKLRVGLTSALSRMLRWAGRRKLPKEFVSVGARQSVDDFCLSSWVPESQVLDAPFVFAMPHMFGVLSMDLSATI